MITKTRQLKKALEAAKIGFALTLHDLDADCFQIENIQILVDGDYEIHFGGQAKSASQASDVLHWVRSIQADDLHDKEVFKKLCVENGLVANHGRNEKLYGQKEVSKPAGKVCPHGFPCALDRCQVARDDVVQAAIAWFRKPDAGMTQMLRNAAADLLLVEKDL